MTVTVCYCPGPVRIMGPHFNCLSSAASLMEVETAVEQERNIQLRSFVTFTTCLQEARARGDKL